MLRFLSINRKWDKIVHVPLLENIVEPEDYLLDILDTMDRMKKDLITKEYTLEKACSILNHVFKKSKIKFMPQKRIAYGNEYYINFGINKGATIPDKYATIGIFLNNNFLKMYGDEKFYKKFLLGFTEVLKHELIHRGQDLKVKDIKLRDKVMSQSDDWKIEKYLSNKQEVMAFAWQIVERFRIEGYSNIEIKNLLKSDSKPKLSSSNILANYHYLFKKDIKKNKDVLKLLYKYMYMYLDT